MEPVLPWYKSAIIRQQVVAFLLAAFGLFKFSTDLDVDATVTAIFAGIAAVIPIWTIVTRLFKPNPNMTTTAAAKEIQLRKDGTMPADPLIGVAAPSAIKPTQGGFFRPSFALLLSGISILALVLLSGCAVNPHKTAQTVEQHGDAVYGQVVIAMEQGSRVIQDASLADTVKRPIAEAIVAAKPVADGMQDTLILYSQIRGQVDGLADTAARLAVVDRELAGWIAKAQPLIDQLVRAIAGARP